MRWFKIVLLFLVVIVILMSAVRYHFSQMYKAEIAKIKASGGPVTIADLVGQPIPDDQNGAVVYEQVFKLAKRGTTSKGSLEWLTSEAKRKSNPNIWQEAESEFNGYQNLFPLVEKAVSLPQCQFKRDWSKGPALIFTEFAEIRTLARICGCSAILNAHNGRMDEAVHYMKLSFKVGDSLKDEPTIIGFLVRSAVMAIASASFRESLKYGDINENQAKELFDLLSEVDYSKSFRQAVQGERVIFMLNMDLMRAQAHKSTGTGTVGLYNPSSSAVSEVKDRVLGFAYDKFALDGDTAVYLRCMDEQSKSASMTFKEAKSAGIFDLPDLPVYAVMSEIMAPVQGKAVLLRFRNETTLVIDQVFLALIAYKDRYGVYPKDLSDLHSKLGWKLPKDIYSGEDLKYVRQAKGFLLYSVGPNLKDDGGVQYDRRAPTQLSDKGDVVLRWER